MGKSLVGMLIVMILARWHVKYVDGDSEDLSEDELKVHVEHYNRVNNR